MVFAGKHFMVFNSFATSGYPSIFSHFCPKNQNHLLITDDFNDISSFPLLTTFGLRNSQFSQSPETEYNNELHLSISDCSSGSRCLRPFCISLKMFSWGSSDSYMDTLSSVQGTSTRTWKKEMSKTFHILQLDALCFNWLSIYLNAAKSSSLIDATYCSLVNFRRVLTSINFGFIRNFNL